MKLPEYFYSNDNIIGSLLASAALVAHLLGYPHNLLWVPLAAIAYGIGAGSSKVLPKHTADSESPSPLSDADILQGLGQIATEAPKLLPSAIASDVVQICTLLKTAISALDRVGAQATVAHDVRTTATRYLPQTINGYLQMPPEWRTAPRKEDGRTPQQMLAEQISTLKNYLQELNTNLADDDASRISENGRFIREKFAKPDFA